MKKNIILKGMFLLVLCVARVVDAKSTSGQIVSSQGQQTGAGQTSSTSTAATGIRGRIATTPTPKIQVSLSTGANLLLNDIQAGKFRTEAAIDNRLVEMEQQGFKFTNNDVAAINAEVERLKAGAQASQTKEVLSDKDRTILRLEKRLEQQEILFNQLLAERQAAQQPGLIAQAAAIPVAVAIAGFDKLAYWVAGRESWPVRLKATTEYLKMQLDDLGKYPTIGSKLSGIAEQDFKNISHIDAELFSEALRQLQLSIKKAQSAQSPQEKAQQDKIDNFIADIRKKYGYQDDEAGLISYKNRIEQNEKDLDKYRAVVSEYLRATSKIAWLEEEKKRKAEEDRKAAEAKRLQQQQASQQQPAGNPQVTPAGAGATPQQQQAKSSSWWPFGNN